MLKELQAVEVDDYQLDAEPYTTAEIIAKNTGITVRSINKVITTHKESLEQFGFLRFKIAKIVGRGRPHKIYCLNEQQATLLIMFLKNTDTVVEFKELLVKEFFAMKSELKSRQDNRLAEKPLRKSFQDAVKEWEYSNPYMYSTLSNLMLKKVTGMNAKQLKTERSSSHPALDLLTVEEQQTYSIIENLVIGLLIANLDYSTIKATVAKFEVAKRP